MFGSYNTHIDTIDVNWIDSCDFCYQTCFCLCRIIELNILNKYIKQFILPFSFYINQIIEEVLRITLARLVYPYKKIKL